MLLDFHHYFVLERWLLQCSWLSSITLRNSGVDPLGLGPLPFKSQKTQKSQSSCLIAVSPRGSNEAKETAGMTLFFYQSNTIFSG